MHPSWLYPPCIPQLRKRHNPNFHSSLPNANKSLSHCQHCSGPILLEKLCGVNQDFRMLQRVSVSNMQCFTQFLKTEIFSLSLRIDRIAAVELNLDAMLALSENAAIQFDCVLYLYISLHLCIGKS